MIFKRLIIKKENVDNDYINDLSIKLENRAQSILEYFDLKEIMSNVEVVLWYNLNDFRNFAKEKMQSNIPEWMCGWVQNTKTIHVLTLDELRKCEKHENNDIDDLENIIVHEFVHILVKQITGGKKIKKWLNEALATSLSMQKHNYRFNLKVENLKNDDFVDYGFYQLVGDYLINEKGRKYIIRLMKESSFLEEEITNIYNGIKKYFENIK